MSLLLVHLIVNVNEGILWNPKVVKVIHCQSSFKQYTLTKHMQDEEMFEFINQVADNQTSTKL